MSPVLPCLRGLAMMAGLMCAARSVMPSCLLGKVAEANTRDELCRVFIWPSLAPVKDMEIVLLGEAMCDQTFVKALHAVLRLMIDDLDVKTFNVAVFGIDLGQARAGASAAHATVPRSNGNEAQYTVRAGSSGRPRSPIVARCSLWPARQAITMIVINSGEEVGNECTALSHWRAGLCREAS